MIEFIDDDLSYLGWDAAHPDGYVLNVRRSPDPRNVILHRANCMTISNSVSSEAMLQGAAKREGRSDGTPSKRCGHCLPLIGS